MRLLLIRDRCSVKLGILHSPASSCDVMLQINGLLPTLGVLSAACISWHSARPTLPPAGDLFEPRPASNCARSHCFNRFSVFGVGAPACLLVLGSSGDHVPVPVPVRIPQQPVRVPRSH